LGKEQIKGKSEEHKVREQQRDGTEGGEGRSFEGEREGGEPSHRA